MTEENKIEEVKEVAEVKHKNKVKDSHWAKFFSENYSLPIHIANELIKFFDDNVGEDYRVDAEFDHFYQQNVIKILIKCSQSFPCNEGETWHDHYTKYVEQFNGKSIGNILRGDKDA